MISGIFLPVDGRVLVTRFMASHACGLATRTCTSIRTSAWTHISLSVLPPELHVGRMADLVPTDWGRLLTNLGPASLLTELGPTSQAVTD